MFFWLHFSWDLSAFTIESRKKYHPSGLRRDANKLQLSETFFSIWKSCSAKAKKTKIFFAVFSVVLNTIKKRSGLVF